MSPANDNRDVIIRPAEPMTAQRVIDAPLSPAQELLMEAWNAPAVNEGLLIMPDDPDVIRFWSDRGYEVYDQDDGLAYMRRRHPE